jgi:hypothetical protein
MREGNTEDRRAARHVTRDVSQFQYAERQHASTPEHS